MSDQLRAAAQAAIKAWDALHGSAEYAPGIGDRMEDFEFREMQALRAAAQAPSEGADAMRKLAAFGAWCAEEFRESLSDVDGGSAQDAMERCGVIVKREVQEPCGDGCVCVEYGEFPHECYSFPAEIRAAIAASAGGKEQDHG